MQFKIPRVVIGENSTFGGNEDFLRAPGVEVVVLDDERCTSLMRRFILDSATEYAIFTTDLDRRVTSWNAGAERLLGWTEKEIMSRSADIIFTPEDRAAGVPEREAAKALAEGRAENERWHLRRKGARFWASGQSMPLRDPAAGPNAPALGLLAVMRDQTERRWAEERRGLLANELLIRPGCS